MHRNHRVKQNHLLTIFSLLSILLFTLHLADDIVRGMSPGGLLNLIAVVICVVWLYGALILTERRSGYIIILVASLLVMGIPVVHLKGPGVGFGTHRSNGLFFVWTLLAVGVVSFFSVILSIRALWNLRRGQPKT